MRILLFLLILFISFQLSAQELRCTVEINSSQLAINDPTLFENMKQLVYDFINNRKWTPDNFKNDERIDCSILINLTKRVSNERFEATIQVSSRRPVFGSSYNSTMISHLDQDFDFNFQQFTVLEFSENTFISNISSVLTYYVYLMLGHDYDSFSEDGGTPYYQQALNVVNNAQSTEFPGWKAFENQTNRYWIIENTLSPRFKGIRKAMYIYHREGLDKMAENPVEARKKIFEALEQLKVVYENIPNSINLRMFFNSKADEIVNIYSDAPREEQNKVINLLNSIDPANTNKYQKILE